MPVLAAVALALLGIPSAQASAGPGDPLPTAGAGRKFDTPGHHYGRASTGAPSKSVRTATALRSPAATVSVGDLPFGVVHDPNTGTVYVAKDAGVAVIDGAHCNARIRTGCGSTPTTAPAGHGNIGITLDPTTRTVYVASGGDGTVGVIDTSTCNAHLTSGCAGPHPAAPVGSLPSHVAADPAHHTLYVSNEGADSPGSTVSMIDTATCNGHRTSGCIVAAPTLTSGAAPSGLVLDRKHHTLFVANGNDGTVSVIDTNTCNTGHPSGCPAVAPTVQLNGFPVGGALDPVSGSLMIPTSDPVNFGDAPGWLSLIDTSTCNATALAGCSRAPVRTALGSGPIDVAVNTVTRRAYVGNQSDSDVSVVDLTRCSATHPGGCRQTWPRMDIGFDAGAVATVPGTDTIYASAQEQANVTVLDGTTCNTGQTVGCRHPAPTTQLDVGPAGSVLDRHTRTLYVANQISGTVSVIAPDACNAGRLAGCRQTWPTVTVGQIPKAVAVDEALDTLYVVNEGDSTVSAVDTRACNSHLSSGCRAIPRTITVTGGAFNLDLDPATHTLYVANVDSDTVSVIDTAHCNARIATGCTQAPATVRTGNAPIAVLVDRTTGTLYVSNNADNTVALVDTRTCNGRSSSGCTALPATVPIVAPPRFLTLDPGTTTLYVSTRNDSSLAMVDTRTCNAQRTTGCATPPPVVKVGFLPYSVLADPGAGKVFVGNVGDSTVSSVDIRTCNSRIRSGCTRPQPAVETGGWPTNLSVDDVTGTLYVSQNVDTTASVVNLRALT